MYTYEEALAASVEYFDGGELEASVFLDKYALKDPDGNLLEKTPADMHRRLAKELARIEAKYPNPMSEDEIFELLEGFKRIVPQGSPMAGIGNLYQVMAISNCYVVDSDGADSYGGIFQIDERIAQLAKRRGGIGADLSFLRPAHTTVKNAARTSTGAVSFMERYSNTTREVAQAGRRGALMLSLDMLHPDSPEFIDIKMDETKVTGANISLRQRDEFMHAVKRGDTEFTLRWPIDAKPEEAKVTRVVNPQEIWYKIIHNAWARAEPGQLFFDRIWEESLPNCYAAFGFKESSTNPCGELPLPSGDSCRLLAVNLYSYVIDPFKPQARFNWDLFRSDVAKAQRLMDDIVDLEIESVEKIIDKVKSDPEPDHIKFRELNLWELILKRAQQGRRTGNGITAMGDTLAALGYKYGTVEATTLAVQIMQEKKWAEYGASVQMAKERGAFEIWNPELEKDNPFLLRIKAEKPELYNEIMQYGRRNIALSTIAPTGTVSLMTRTTSGIENLFMPVYYRAKKVVPGVQNVRVDYVDAVGDSWMEYPVFHPKFKDYLRVQGLTDALIQNLTKDEINYWVQKSPYWGATSNDTDWVEKVRMQGAIQRHIDHSISVTVNLPKDISIEKVGEVYMAAWEAGCKGVTVYRDGSRSGVLKTESSANKKPESLAENHAPKRPKELKCVIQKFHNKGEAWLAFIGLYEDKPYEIFTGLASNFKIPTKINSGLIRKTKVDGKNEYHFIWHKDGVDMDEGDLSTCFNPEYWDFAKLISMLLRHGTPLQYLVTVLDKLTFDAEGISTWKKGVIRAIKKFVADGTELEARACDDDTKKCQLVYQDGCVTCKECGLSKCG